VAQDVGHGERVANTSQDVPIVPPERAPGGDPIDDVRVILKGSGIEPRTERGLLGETDKGFGIGVVTDARCGTGRGQVTVGEEIDRSRMREPCAERRECGGTGAGAQDQKVHGRAA
jgi:hypothetical protein